MEDKMKSNMTNTEWARWMGGMEISRRSRELNSKPREMYVKVFETMDGWIAVPTWDDREIVAEGRTRRELGLRLAELDRPVRVINEE
jgi:hypothetical protein